MRPVIEAGRDLSFGRCIRKQFVCGDPFGAEAMPLDLPDQHPRCCALMPSGLKDFFQHDTLLIDGAPQPV